MKARPKRGNEAKFGVNKNLYLEGFSHGFGRVPQSSLTRLKKSIEKVRGSVGHGLYRLFEDILPAEAIRLRSGERKRSYDTRSTFWAMLGQVFRQSSLREAVRELQVMDRICGRAVRSGNTGPYCKARQRLGLDAVASMHAQVCEKLDQLCMSGDEGRLLSVDATFVRLDDTSSNRSAYGYGPSQKEGCGYPVAQLVTLKNLHSGAVIDAVDSPNRDGESPWFSAGLIQHIQEDDTVLADRAYCSYYNFVRLNQMGANGLMRLHGTRNTSALKKCDDTVVTWTKSRRAHVPGHVSEQEYAQLPRTLRIRLIRARIQQKGFRTQEILLATTLFDKPAADIIALYHRRWEIETGFRHLKTTLGMDHLHVKSAQMARKLIYLFFVAHNLICSLMLKAGHGPKVLSFKGTLDCINRWASEMASLGRRRFNQILEDMLTVIAKDKVPIRPGRTEPRCIKAMTKKYERLTVHRHKHPHRFYA